VIPRGPEEKVLNSSGIDIFPFRFECQRCGICCREVPDGIRLYAEDVTRISSYLGLQVESFVRKYCRLIHVDFAIDGEVISMPILSVRQVRNVCPFCDKNKCLIQSCKPYLCKAAPFIWVLFERASCFEGLRTKCPGFGKGKLYNVADIMRQLNEEDGLEKSDFIHHKKGFYSMVADIIGKEAKSASVVVPNYTGGGTNSRFVSTLQREGRFRSHKKKNPNMEAEI
jgi:Fe-S-cluster containining protein